jgi:hypothetical protein
LIINCTNTGHFGESGDQAIRIRKCFGGNRAVEAVEASEVAEATKVNEAAEVSPEKSLLRSSKLSRFLNSII